MELLTALGVVVAVIAAFVSILALVDARKHAAFPIQPIRDIEPDVAATIVGREAGRYLTTLGM